MNNVKKYMKYWMPTTALLLLAITLLLSRKMPDEKEQEAFHGALQMSVSARGEINGENSVKIELPPELCDNELRVWQYRITDLVQEGKHVKKGDFIAQLDQTQLLNNLSQWDREREQVQLDFNSTMLDTAVTFATRRQRIIDASLDLQYAAIDLELSKFEAGAVQRKAEMAYQKAEMYIEKLKRDYVLATNGWKERMKLRQNSLDYQNRRVEKIRDAIGRTTIVSPASGIVMIARDRARRKLTKDRNVFPWNPTIALLPDMSSVIVTTYIREIDIAKIKVGDSVRITVDALPKKLLTAKVQKIANVGESRRGFEMNVFEVLIRLDRSDPDLKPGMTCNTDIIIRRFDDALLVPIAAVFKQGKQRFVYLRRDAGKIVRQPVEVGGEDDKNAVITGGLSEGDRVLLYNPAG
ncbi:MAG: efflux RND transporter periplasmic adaptor subunit [Bacteroidales bacterium]|jgi:RND family efflux transporter MFP subunit|nr:efflux RND transporter periplasmic adaptor subunit [Bacteroidales bacterium]